MRMKLLNVVVFAENYNQLVQWYQNAFDLELIYEEKGEYHYTELGYDGRLILGITPAKEMEHKPTKPKNNSSIMQLGVSDINSTFKQVVKYGGTVLFGPTYEEQNKFHYGGVADIEGNTIWFIEENK